MTDTASTNASVSHWKTHILSGIHEVNDHKCVAIVTVMAIADTLRSRLPCHSDGRASEITNNRIVVGRKEISFVCGAWPASSNFVAPPNLATSSSSALRTGARTNI
jgi:hypothetical protein